MTIHVPSFRPDGSEFDLANVQASDIVWSEIANGLSKIARFNGRYSGPAYSVAQHCVMGADALFEDAHAGGDAVCAGYFLLHDAHEALTGDIVRPMVSLIDSLLPVGGVKAAIEACKAAIDKAVWQAANLPPIDRMPVYRRHVADMDERMLRAEAVALFGPKAGEALPAASAPRLTGAIIPWGPAKAELAYLNRLERYLDIVVRPT